MLTIEIEIHFWFKLWFSRFLCKLIFLVHKLCLRINFWKYYKEILLSIIIILSTSPHTPHHTMFISSSSRNQPTRLMTFINHHNYLITSLFHLIKNKSIGQSNHIIMHHYTDITTFHFMFKVIKTSHKF